MHHLKKSFPINLRLKLKDNTPKKQCANLKPSIVNVLCLRLADLLGTCMPETGDGFYSEKIKIN